MVQYVLALALLPLALAGSMYPQQQPMQMFPQQKNWGGYGVQMQGMIEPMGQMQQQGGMQQHGGMQQQGSNQWWTATSAEEYEDYLKWCEERKMAMQEQEQQQALLKEMEEKYKEQERARERERASKELESKREAMATQWRMWKAQLSMADEFDGIMEHFMEMKGMYSFKVLTEFLKFCKCTDYASHLSKYLMYGKESYTPSASDLFAVDGFETVDTSDVDAVARRAAALSTQEQVKLFFGGAIDAMCGGMRTYLQQVVAWEAQYNFMV